MSKIIRAMLPFEQQFAQIPNRILRDDRLSYKARGVLGVLLSHRHGFETTLASLCTSRDGRSAVRAAVKELEEVGYLVRERRRCSKTGRIEGFDWTLCDPGDMDNPVENPGDK